MHPDSDQAVDIVYLWVNGSDPVWRLKRQIAAALLGGPHTQAMAVHGNVEGRFRDNDELRYSLRALTRYFPAHGHVYVVTDGQAPAWLRPSSRLTLVDHRDLIPADKLPTFDSGNIESYIHRIPNLSERYFYLNDDVFFGAPVRLEDWFYDGGTYVAWSDDGAVSDEPLRADATALENACRLSNTWLGAQATASALIAPLYSAAYPAVIRDADLATSLAAGFATHDAPGHPADGRTGYEPVFRTFAHSPRPMLKSQLVALEALAPELFEQVRSTVFRTWNKPPIVSDFVLRWALTHGQARLCQHSHLYVSTGCGAIAELDAQLSELIDAVGQLDFFCINDTTDDAPARHPRLARVRDALQKAFPHPSPFEQHPRHRQPVSAPTPEVAAVV